jgi:hypothetical protein
MNPASAADYTYEYVSDHAFYMHVAESAFILPNTCYVVDDIAGFNYIGHAHDSSSVTALGEFKIPIEDASVTSDADCEKRATAWISKRVAEANQGMVVVPTNCGQELYDMITITDTRSGKTSTGRAARIEWEYEPTKDTDTMAIYLGGVSQTPGGMRPGTVDSDISDLSVITNNGLPDWSDIPYVDWSTILPKAIQGYQHDVHFAPIIAAGVYDQTHIAWTSTNGINFYDGTHIHVTENANSEIPSTGIYYIYFDASEASPVTLHYTTDFASLLTGANASYLGLLCMVQRGSAPGIAPTILPSYGKEPLITTDMIQMAGFKTWTDPATGIVYDAILGTDVTAGHITLSAIQTAGATTIINQESIPTSTAIGDVWIKTSTGQTYCAASVGANEIKAGEWVLFQDEDIAAALQVASDAQDTADGKIVTFVQTSIPTSTDVGDLWVDSDDDNKLYRAASIGANEIKAGEWVLVRDSGISTALSDAATAIANAATAQGEADSKIITYFQNDAPTTNLTVGDLWVDTNDHYRVYRYTGSGWTEILFIGNWYQKTGVVLDAVYGISLYGGHVALRTFATETAYNTWVGGADIDSLTGVQCYIGTDGAICAGSGAISLGYYGIKLTGTGSGNYGLAIYNQSGIFRGYINAYDDDIQISCNRNTHLYSGSSYSIILEGAVLLNQSAPEFNFTGGDLKTNGWNGSVFRNVKPYYDGDSYDSETIGISGTPYNEGHFYDIYYTVAHDLDILKDSEAIKNIKSKGDGTLDISTFPEAVRYSGVKKLRNLQKLDYVIKNNIKDGELDSKGLPMPKKIREKSVDSINAGAMMGLTIGTLKELIARVEVLEEKIGKKG